VVIAPWLDASIVDFDTNQPIIKLALHLNAVGDLSTGKVALYTTNDLVLLKSGAGLETDAAVFPLINLTNAVGTNEGVRRYYLQTITNPVDSAGFFRVKINP